MRWTKNYVKKSLISYVFLLPVFIGMAVFAVYPIAMSLIYSFTDFNGWFATQIGVFNYVTMFDMSPGGQFFEIFNSFAVTFIYVIGSTLLNMVLSYILALFLKKEIPGIRVIRMLCYLPVLIPGFVSGFVWGKIFAYNAEGIGNGIINSWLMRMGLPTLTFFASSQTSLITLILTNLWTIGGGMIMLLAAFANISPEYYEASKIDGAGYFKQLFYITIPMSTPILFYNVVVSIISGLQIFATMAAYGTGMEDSLYFIAIRIYRTAFTGSNNYGLACAEGYLLFLIIALLSLVMFKFNGWVHYGDE